MDEDRFEATWDQHWQALTRYCTFSTGSSQDGEDVAAEVFSQLLATKRTIALAKIEAWLFTVARNLCASHHRRAERDRRLLGRLSADQHTSTAQAWSDPELWEAVRKLGERARLVVYLRVVEGRAFADVARAVDISEAAAKMTFYRAMKRTRAWLESSEYEPIRPDTGGVVDVD